MKPLDSKGFFFKLEEPEKKIPGFITFTPKKGISVDLIGCLSKESDLFSRTYNIVNGKIGNTLISLVDAYETQHSIHFDDVDYSKLTSRYAFLNVNFLNPKRIDFKKVHSTFKYFVEWTNRSESFDVKNIKSKKRVNLNYKFPDSINFDIEPKIKGKILFTLSGLKYGYYQNEFNLKQSCVLEIESKTKKDFSYFLELLNHFKKFLILATQKNIYEKDIVFWIKEKSDKFPHEIPLLYRIPKFKNEEEVIPKSFLFEYDDIKEIFPISIHNWFRKKEKLEITLNSFFKTFGDNVFKIETFLSVVKSLESFHREFVNNSDLNQVDRYYDSFERVRKSFNPYLKIRSKRKFCEKIRNYRNDFTHNNPEAHDSSVNFNNLFMFTEKLKMILIANILFEIGFDLNRIYDLFGKSSAFIHIKRH